MFLFILIAIAAIYLFFTRKDAKINPVESIVLLGGIGFVLIVMLGNQL